MQFQVPQFIEVEDKIFGPLSFRQFIYLVGGAGFSFLAWKLFPAFIAVFFIIPVAGLALALTFYKVNEQPFIKVLEAALRYTTRKKLYLWRKGEKKMERKKESDELRDNDVFVPRLSESKLKDITWSLDVQESIYSGQDDRPSSSGK